MINVSFNSKKTLERTYPYIGEYRYSGESLYVLFYKENSGMVLYSDIKDREVGLYINKWDESQFNVSELTFTLSNK